MQFITLGLIIHNTILATKLVQQQCGEEEVEHVIQQAQRHHIEEEQELATQLQQ